MDGPCVGGASCGRLFETSGPGAGRAHQLAAVARVRRPGLFLRVVDKLALAASVLLLVAILPVPIASWRVIVAEIGSFTLGAVVTFVLAGLASGHLLGGPDEGDRTVLALATATRHPAVAIAIAHATAPDQKTVPAAVVLYLVVAAVVSVPYVKWRAKRAHGVPAHGG